MWTDQCDARVAILDPLEADALMHDVPRMNEVADVRGLASLLETLCSRAEVMQRSYDELAAIVRDVGMVAGSICRHGEQPGQLVPSLEALLIAASAMTEMPARDTLMHYTVWNPTGARQRTYTSNPEEPHLIESIRTSLPAIRDATRELFALRAIDFGERRAARVGAIISRHLKSFLAGLHHAIEFVKPETFITEFRPYFEPLLVNQTSLRGPGAVTMPLHLFDFLLWGSTEPDPTYQAFTAAYVPYNLPELRQYYWQQRHCASLLDLLEADAGDDVPRAPKSFLRQVALWFRRIRGFRSAHIQYAIAAYHGKAAHTFATGSGGHTAKELELVAELTAKHALRVDTLMKKEPAP